MARRLNFKRKLDQTVESTIEEFLNYAYEPQIFGEIQTHLKKRGIKYKNSDNDRSGLAHTLKRMIKQKRIRKITDNTHRFPRYTTLSKSTFEAALDGHLMKTESTKFVFSGDRGRLSDIDIDSEFPMPKTSYQEQLVRKLVTCIGVQTLYLVLSSYERPIDPKKSEWDNIANREAWLKNALSYHNPKELSLDDQIENYLADSDVSPIQFENKRMLKKIKSMKKQLVKLYPNITGNMMYTENDMDSSKEALRSHYLNGGLSSIIIE